MTERVTKKTPTDSLTTRARAFRRDEEGGLIIFSLFLFVAMIAVGGLAVDLMMYENKRVHMQNSTDRAVLAAASLDQTVDPKVVVKDYLAKSGIHIELDDVKVVNVGAAPVITGRRVSVDVAESWPTMLSSMVGLDRLPLRAVSEATEAINDIEISLVLDISGSMDDTPGKLQNLKDAAKKFVTNTIGNNNNGRVSISLVPYATQVSLGPHLLATLNTEHNHNRSHCVNFDATDFDTTAIDDLTPLSQTAHFDPWKGWWQGRTPQNFVCRTEDHVDILPWSENVNALTGQIDDFQAAGNTSIDLAVKWGAALLDPSMQDSLDDLVIANRVSNTFTGRPYAHNRPDSLKFIVVMTDGVNTDQFELKDAYKTGLSPIYRDTATGRYSSIDEEYRDTDRDNDWWEDYWYERGGYWIDNPYDSDGGGSNSVAVRLPWLDVWAQMSMARHAYDFHYVQYNNANHYYNNLYGPRNRIDAATKDDRLDKICDASKNNGTIIFTIGFEVTDDSAAVMRSCASTPSHFYRVEGLDLDYAFSSIANQINQLKLTQ